MLGGAGTGAGAGRGGSCRCCCRALTRSVPILSNTECASTLSSGAEEDISVRLYIYIYKYHFPTVCVLLACTFVKHGANKEVPAESRANIEGQGG